MKPGIVEDGLCVKIYNPEEKKLIAVFENYSKAANKLGLTHKAVLYYAQCKKRTIAPLFNMEVAIRMSKQKDEDLNLILITNKRGRL